jgi:hypothetical protein
MEKFWAVILIFVVVAAAGLMYVNQVYNPQRETQEAMAEMASQTLTVVETEIGDGSSSREYYGSEIINKVESYIDMYSDIEIKVGGVTYTDINDGIEVTKKYHMSISRVDDDITEINITEV